MCSHLPGSIEWTYYEEAHNSANLLTFCKKSFFSTKITISKRYLTKNCTIWQPFCIFAPTFEQKKQTLKIRNYKDMNRQRLRLGLITAAALLPLGMMGQETLTLEQCREMALQNNKSIEQAKTRVEMAGYDRKIARANYFPNISATGA